MSRSISLIAACQVALFASATAYAVPETIKDCDQCPEMIVIPAGQFVMGASGEDGREDDEAPARTVMFAQSFAVGKYEVTFDEWGACVADGACKQVPDEGWGRGRRPVINIDFTQANGYVKWLSAKTGKTYALPSEAQWEYAARAGANQETYWGKEKARACEHANIFDPLTRSKLAFDWAAFPCDDTFVGTAPAGSFAANAFGLHDMLGNVWEWVADCYRPSYKGASTDGSVVTADTCMKQLSRGGSWNIFPEWVRTGYRYGLQGGLRANNLGLRVTRTMP